MEGQEEQVESLVAMKALEVLAVLLLVEVQTPLEHQVIVEMEVLEALEAEVLDLQEELVVFRIVAMELVTEAVEPEGETQMVETEHLERFLLLMKLKVHLLQTWQLLLLPVLKMVQPQSATTIVD
jgi:hypothetical protein